MNCFPKMKELIDVKHSKTVLARLVFTIIDNHFMTSIRPGPGGAWVTVYF